MCKSCESFSDLLKEGEEGKKKAARLLFDEEIIQKHARYFFWKYQRYMSKDYDNWEDFYIEIVLRIFREKEAGRGPRENCDGYYYKLTRNICEEMVRFTNRSNEVQKQLLLLDEVTGDPHIIEKVKHYIQQMECKCSTLLYHYHIEEQLVRDKQELVVLLKEKCGKDYTTGSVPVHLSGCLNKLTQLIQQDTNRLF
ncbi:MAG: hypothetical protein IPO85_18090 [Saprospiraceae bacterium]|uniref:Uncharacterized protein n=1 Tax=Candidatus Defluviibacterium haderslevense TaxID=2981993 RepID=A0A9D7XJ64_9BACT|nr:hypothetical protein [Candidatus Defluviibacterium haderslevense]